MRKRSLFCIAASESQAADIVRELKATGFTNNDISALLPDKTGSMDFIHARGRGTADGIAWGGIIGAIVFAILGWLAGTGILAIPSLGPFIAAGPVMAALAAAFIGTAFCGILGGWFGSRVPKFEARRCAGKLRQGNILLSVHCETRAKEKDAKKIFHRAGGQDIAARAELAIKSRSDDVVAALQPEARFSLW
ncbi:MAG TPA: DUF3341 domain-containing protein [Verrucomicrobiae bacterium]|nr:DUF3341 domain-containing protein [Verrucomicrobiae bacterium]